VSSLHAVFGTGAVGMAVMEAHDPEVVEAGWSDFNPAPGALRTDLTL
jgi:hypothetical protein